MLKKYKHTISIIVVIILSVIPEFICANPQAGQTLEFVNQNIQGQKQVIIGYIECDNSVSAAAAFDKLLTDYGKSDLVIPAVYEAAEKYREKAQHKSAVSAYKYVVDNFPISKQAVWAQRGLIVSSIAIGDTNSAQVETQNLINNYNNDPNIAQAVFEVADAYYWFGKNDNARQLYQKVIDTWPESGHSMWSQMGLAIAYIADGNEANADSATDKLISNYGNNKKLPEALFYIGARYVYANKYDKGQDIYRYIIDNFGDSEWSKNSQFESAKAAIYPYLEAADEPNALAAIDNFVAAYKDKPELPAIVYDFAARVDRQNKDKLSDLSKGIYNRVGINFPQAVQSKSSALIIRKAEIMDLVNSGDDANALSAVIGLVKDFKGNAGLPDAVYYIGREYWKAAFAGQSANDQDQAQKAFAKAADIWVNIEKLMPISEPDVVEYTYHDLSICYQRLGQYQKATEYYNKVLAIRSAALSDVEFGNRDFICGDWNCGAYVVWHCLQYYGLQPSINEVISKMGVMEKSYSSIADIVAFLEEKGISAEGVKISFDTVKSVNKPFIQYLVPAGYRPVGHFVFCLPTGNGKAVVLDGREEPKVVDLSMYRADNFSQTRWDGTAILIEGLRADFLRAVKDWNILLNSAYVWVNSLNNTGNPFLYSELSAESQQTVLGGWTGNWDCTELSKNCNTVTLCSEDSDCVPGKMVCYDTTIEEKCNKTHGDTPCVYDACHMCGPLKVQTGTCPGLGFYCSVTSPDYGDCTGFSNSYIYQCHDE
jgi:tetratricopeptide (TPR) repeat protein